jgi:hypothetical protein
VKQIRKRLTYANVMSSIAVFLVLGGATALAAGHLGKNSVGATQLKKNAVTATKIKNGTITGAKVKAGSLTGAQVNASTLGTVPTAQTATTANTAQTANSLAAPEAWHEVGAAGQPGFLNSWANATGAFHGEPVSFYKDHEGVVHLRGQAVSGTGVMFHLPPGFRPANGIFIRVPMACLGGTLCEKDASSAVIVGSSFPVPADEGEVETPAGATMVWLDGVTFRAGS